jgi:diguanylate cyclase (GGDEF)-like protein
MFTKILSDAISKSNRSQSIMALFFLDIDHFKSINDNLGHDIGDELLKQFAKRLQKSIRDYDVAARLGGDEFVILLENIDTQQTAIHIAEKITTSIGISFNQGENVTPDELLKQADQALYLSKEGGRNQFTIYKQEK